jgi:glutamate-ammonia-ligase adenylyltransferase
MTGRQLSESPIWLSDIIAAVPALDAHPQFISDLQALRQRFPEVATPHLLTHVAACLLNTVEPMRAMNHLLHYLNVSEAPDVLWRQWQQHPETVTYTLTVFAASSFLSAMLCRHPDWLLWLLQDAIGKPSPTPEALAAELQQQLPPDGAEAESDVADILRAFTHRHLVRIGAQDLNDLADIEATTAALSALADTVVQAGVGHCRKALEVEYGKPTFVNDTGEQQTCEFGVIGMGKLGGYELNFASDIDLMYVYDSYQGQTSGALRNDQWRAPISNHEFFVKLSQRLTNLIGGKGPDGQAFRVDLRLRPDGTQGQLALALLAYEAYYTRFGQTWERMALLKARPIAGDARLGDAFMALVQPFVYQRHLDREGLQRIRDMKHEIDVQIADKAQSHTNVKLGLGGIREIEFFIQIHQLIYGGRHLELQDRQSLSALAKLHDTGFISAELETTLRERYIYLRRLEHRLQMEQGSQTHTLPRQESSRQRLARQYGFETWDAFYQDYLEKTQTVHDVFTRVFDHDLEPPPHASETPAAP